MIRKPFPQKRLTAFSALELLVIVSIVSVLLAIGIPGVVKLSSSMKDTKLESDLVVLNSAVKSYLLFGGNLNGDESLAVVLTKLKSRASDETAGQVVGLRGTFLDPRFEPIMQTAEEAATDVPRGYWDASKKKFVSATSGPPGIKEFRIDHDYVPSMDLTETRETAVQYAHNSDWIWDYQDSAAPTYIQATPIAVSASPTEGSIVPLAPPLPTAPSSPPSSAPPGDPATVLDPPTFSLPPGTHPISDFNLLVSIVDPNPEGSSIYYSIDSGSWEAYTGALSIPPGTVLKAQAYPTSSDYLFSSVTQGTYDAGPVTLFTPVISLSAGNFNLPGIDSINVHFDNPNDATVSRVDYRINGGPWQPFSSDFAVTAAAYPGGLTIEAYTVATAPFWVDSGIISSPIGDITPPPDVDFDMSVSTEP